MEETRLVKMVYNHSKFLYISKNTNNFANQIHQLAEKYSLQDIWYSEQKVREKSEELESIKAVKEYWFNIIHNNIHKKEEEHWLLQINLHKPKLRLYKTIKHKLQLEPYLLTQKDKVGRYLLTSLRSGTNKLRIETGRHKKPKKEKVKDRICMNGR